MGTVIPQHSGGLNGRHFSATELSSLAEDTPSNYGVEMMGPNGHGRNGNGSPSDDANGYDMEKGGTRKSRGTPSMTKRAERYKPLTKKRITSRKTSQPLAASDGEHSLLFSVTLAWRAAMKEPHRRGSTDDGTDGTEGTESEDPYGSSRAEIELKVEQMLEAFATMASSVAEAFGPVMSLAVKNDQTNQEKLRNAWVAMTASVDGEQGGTQRVARLRGLLEAEKKTGMHKAGGVLADPSAAIALIWLRRSLDFQNCLLDGLGTDRDALVTNVAREAYRTHLESYHNFWLKNTFRAGLAAMPARGDFIQRLGIHLQESMKPEEIEQICYSEMAELVEVQQKVVATMSALFVELDLEDSRKA